jgi:predicted HD phosphohydrolase
MAAAPMGGENGSVTPKSLDVDDIERLLRSAADRPVEVDSVGDGAGQSGVLAHSHLDHALQTAAVLQRERPGDDELAVAGLVHDIGHLLDGVGDAEHAEAGAAAVREALGERVAGLVGRHVEAKRYLVASEATYGAELAADSVASLVRQGGPMSSDERAAFEATRWADDALVLRRADENAKVEGLALDDLDGWMAVVRRVASRAG